MLQPSVFTAPVFTRRVGSHPYIIELLGVYWVRPEGRAADSGPVEAAIVMELAGGGGFP